MIKPGRLYAVTFRLKIEPGPTFEEKVVTVRAYDATDAVYQASLAVDDPRADKLISIAPAWDEAAVREFDLQRMLGSTGLPSSERKGPKEEPHG